MSVRDLIDKRNALLEREREANDSAKRNGYTAQLRTDLDDLDAQIRTVQGDLDRALRAERRDEPKRNPNAPLNDPEDRGPRRATAPGEIRFLTARESIAEGRAEPTVLPGGMRREDLSFGRYIRGLVTGDWRHAEAEEQLHRDKRAGGGTLGTAGGYLVPTGLADFVIDAARAQTVCLRAGGLTFDMTTPKMTIAKVDGDPSGTWRSENSIVAASTMTFAGIELDARSLGALLTVSRELLQDAPNGSAVIDKALAAQFAIGLDVAGLRGNGASNQPTGIRFGSSVGLSTATSAGSTTWADIVTACGTIWAVNGDPNAVILAPRTAASYGKLLDTTNQSVVPPPAVAALAQYRTSSIPVSGSAGVGSSTAHGSTSATEQYVGDFRQLAFGIRSPFEVEIGTQATDSNNNGFSRNQVLIRAILRADVALLEPSHFVVVLGSTA